MHVRVCMPFSASEPTNFYNIWYEYYVTGGHPNSMYFLTSYDR
jgi:hypothetical protein